MATDTLKLTFRVDSAPLQSALHDLIAAAKRLEALGCAVEFRDGGGSYMLTVATDGAVQRLLDRAVLTSP